MERPQGQVILLVEDNEDIQKMWRQRLSRLLGEVEAEIVSAFTVNEAWVFFQVSLDRIAAIVMDACVPGSTPNTGDLVRAMRAAGYAGPLIAASADPLFRKGLIDAGCNHEAATKTDVSDEVMALIERS